jgi:hypothetical protein
MKDIKDVTGGQGVDRYRSVSVTESLVIESLIENRSRRIRDSSRRARLAYFT